MAEWLVNVSALEKTGGGNKEVLFHLLSVCFPPEDLCNCSSGSEGILDPDDCDQSTGQCSCMSGYAGLQCDDCQEGFFTNGTSGCLPCACDSFGAVNSHCDRSGCSSRRRRSPSLPPLFAFCTVNLHNQLSLSDEFNRLRSAFQNSTHIFRFLHLWVPPAPCKIIVRTYCTCAQKNAASSKLESCLLSVTSCRNILCLSNPTRRPVCSSKTSRPCFVLTLKAEKYANSL